jgi:GT2 family glycosyltransferase
LAQIEAEYYVLLNSDVEVTEHWLEPMIDYLDGHPEVAACQPKILSWRQKDYFEYAGACGGYIDHFGYPFCRGRIMGVVEKDNGQYNEIIPVFWATGASLFIRSADYWNVGGLDGRFFAHMEEIDLCWRLRSRGRGLVCVPQSVVYHVGGATLKKENPVKTFLNFRNNLLMLYKNLPENDLRYVMTVRCMLDYIAAFTFLLKGGAANMTAVLKARKEYRAIRKDFRLSRKENLEKTSLQVIPEQIKKSILVHYYLRGKKYFSQIDRFYLK